MTESQLPIPAAAPSSHPVHLDKSFRMVQWIVFLFCAVLAMVALAELRKTDVPGAPVSLVYASIAAGVITVIGNFPYVFWRLPRPGRWCAYIAILVVLLLTGNEADQMRPVWERSPAGKQEAAERAESDRVAEVERGTAKNEAEEKEKAEQVLSKLAGANAKLEEVSARLESCFTTFGHRLPALEDPVRESMHNPHAFEHVATTLVVPDAEGNDVEMTFRAENAFGALRTATVRAQLVADGCLVQNIGTPQVE